MRDRKADQVISRYGKGLKIMAGTGHQVGEMHWVAEEEKPDLINAECGGYHRDHWKGRTLYAL
jgi:Xaa-Pro aminopeptidase